MEKLRYMSNITKIHGGFILFNETYEFQPWDDNGLLLDEKIMSDTQVLIGTNNGAKLLDLSLTIDDIAYTDINEFVNNLFAR